MVWPAQRLVSVFLLAPAAVAYIQVSLAASILALETDSHAYTIQAKLGALYHNCESLECLLERHVPIRFLLDAMTRLH